MHRIKADIAISARFRLLTEIVEQVLAAALGRLAIGDERIEALVLPPPPLIPTIFLVDETAAHLDVGEAEHHPGIRRMSVPPRAANFLVISVKRGW